MDYKITRRILLAGALGVLADQLILPAIPKENLLSDLDYGYRLSESEMRMAVEEGLEPEVLRIIKEITVNTLFFRDDRRGTDLSHRDWKPPTKADCERADKMCPPGWQVTAVSEDQAKATLAYHNALKYFIHPKNFPKAILEIRKRIAKYSYSTYCINANQSKTTEYKPGEFYNAAASPNNNQEIVQVRRNAWGTKKTEVTRRTVVAILFKKLDQFEYIELLIKARGWDFSNENVQQFKKWDKRYGLNLVGAGRSFVQFFLDKQPEDVMQFYQEIITMCPPAADYKSTLINALVNREMISFDWH